MKYALTFTAAALIAAAPLIAAEGNLTPSTKPPIASVSAPAPATATSAFKSDIEKRSYAVGMTIADSFKTRPEFDGLSIASGFRDVIAGTPRLTDQEKQEIVVAYQNEVQARREHELKTAADKNTDAGKAFLEANKKQPGVTTTATGLQYKVVSTGTGKTRKSPKASDTVTVHYQGTLIDGTEFDSSYKRNQPATFPLNGVIKGWTEGLQKMKTGDKYMFYIPADLAYGDSAAGLIGPNSVLIFQVELISIGGK